MRAFMTFGFPLKVNLEDGTEVRYKNLLDRKDDQVAYMG